MFVCFFFVDGSRLPSAIIFDINLKLSIRKRNCINSQGGPKKKNSNYETRLINWKNKERLELTEKRRVEKLSKL